MKPCVCDVTVAVMKKTVTVQAYFFTLSFLAKFECKVFASSMLSCTSFANKSVVALAFVFSPAVSNQSPALLRARFLAKPVPPAHGGAVTPRPRRTTRGAVYGHRFGTAADSGRATETYPHVAERLITGNNVIKNHHPHTSTCTAS